MNPAYPFASAKGRDLDRIAACLDVTRKRWLWFFREPDFSFRKRIVAAMAASVVQMPVTAGVRIVRGDLLFFNQKTGKVEP